MFLRSLTGGRDVEGLLPARSCVVLPLQVLLSTTITPKEAPGGPGPAGLAVRVSGSRAVLGQHIPGTGNSHSPLILLLRNQQ